MFGNKRKESDGTLMNSTLKINVTANFRSSDSAITLFYKFANFPRNSSVGGVRNVKLGYCKKQPLKQLFFKKVYQQIY